MGRSPGTVALYRRKLGAFGRFLETLEPKPKTLADVTSEHVVAFRDHELSRERKLPSGGPLSASAIALSLIAMKGFFRHQTKRGLLLLDPARELSMPRRPKRLPRNVPTFRQVKLLLLSADTRLPLGKRDRAVTELLYASGLRNAELCALSVSDVNLESRTVFVRCGKGAKDRLVPLGTEAEKAIRDYFAAYPVLKKEEHGNASRPLFLGLAGRPLSPNGLRRIVSRLRAKAGLSTKTTPHSLRHACATHLLKGGASIRQIQVLLGHSSLASTEVYTKVETSDLLLMLDRHHPRSAPRGE